MGNPMNSLISCMTWRKTRTKLTESSSLKWERRRHRRRVIRGVDTRHSLAALCGLARMTDSVWLADILHDPQHRLSVYVLEWKIHQVRLRIDRNRVPMRQMKITVGFKRPVPFVKHINMTRFRSNVQTLGAAIERQHIRIAPNRQRRAKLHRAKINGDNFVVACAGHER